MLHVKSLNKIYETKFGKVEALRDINLEFKSNGLTFILGKSGSGKTTLLNVLAGLDNPTSGNVFYDDIVITNNIDKNLDKYRNLDVGIVFQEYNLLESLNVYDNVAIALEIQSRTEEDNVRIKVHNVLEYVGLDGLEKRKVTELSGGQAQRVAIARALVKEPKVIFADEPTGNLDNKTGIQIIELLKKISEICTVIVITHNEEMALMYGNAIIRIEDGEIISNAKNNSDRSKKYNLYRGTSSIPVCFGLTKEKLSKEIIKMLECNSKVELRIEKQGDEESDELSYEARKNNFFAKPKKLNLKTTFKFALVNIFRKPVRTFLVTLLFGLALFMLMITLYVSRYNSEKVISEYIDKYDITDIYLYKPITYEDSLFDIHENCLTSGEKYKQEIDAIINTSPFSITNKLSIYMADNFGSEDFYEIQDCINFIYNENNRLKNAELAYGKLPRTANEIVITDYLAGVMFGTPLNCIGKELIVSNVNVTVSGVLKTDYITYNYKYKSAYSPNEYTEYKSAREYCLIVLHEDFDEIYNENAQCIEFHFANFTIPDKDINFYHYPDARIGGIDKIFESECELVVGRMPYNETEVIVSEDFYQRTIDSDFMWYDSETDSIMYDKDSFSEKKFLCVDIHAEKYNDYYSAEMSMYDFVQEIKVVGVYSGNNNVDYFVCQELFDEIKSEYSEYGYVSEYGLHIDGTDTIQIVKNIQSKGLRINEPSIGKIYEFTEMLYTIRPILQIILFVVMAITVLVLFSYINFSINVNGRQIGILRAIGASKKDTIKIFLVEIGIITVLALILSYIFDLLIMNYVNDFYMEGIPEKYFDIIVPNIGMNFLLPMVTIIIATISTVLPINIMAKLKPVEIIKEARE